VSDIIQNAQQAQGVNEVHMPNPPENVAIWCQKLAFHYREAEVFNNVSFHVVGAPPRGRIESIGYVPQLTGFDAAFPIRVEEVVGMGRLSGLSPVAKHQKQQEIEWALRQAEVCDLRERPFSALSGGQRRRVLVARALVGHPKLLVLDEPTTNMDAESEKKFYDVLARVKGNTTVLIATHDSDFVSALAETVLCVGQDIDHPHSVHRHAIEQAVNVPEDIYGGKVVRVRHDIELPDDACCEGKE
jgi:zinc transport system ATP-binding protein